MNCYFHPEIEGVVTCGKCGVAMCKECETNAFFRLDGGKGQALCNRCSLTEAQDIVSFESSWLKKRKIKLIFCSIFVLIGLLILIFSKPKGDGIFGAIIFWAISGAIANIGNKKNNDTVKNQVWSAIYEYEHPFMSAIIGIVVNGIIGPIMLIAHFIGYFRTKADYAKDLEILEKIKGVVGQNSI